MLQIFNDTVLDAEFKDNGYVVVDFLSREKCSALKDALMSMDAGVNKKFYASLWSSDKEYRLKVDALIKGAFAEKVKSLFHSNYAPFFADVLVKKPSLFDKFQIHQDWSFVDESKYISLFIWVPLVDVDKQNGYLQIMEKSHRIFRNIRGANIPQPYDKIKSHIERKYLKGIPLPAGKAVIFSQALIHASPPNRSFNDRVAAGLMMLPKEAPIFHYMRDGNNPTLIRKYAVDYNFFMNYSMGKNFADMLYAKNMSLPQGVTEEGQLPYKEEYLTVAAFDEAYSKA